MIRQSYSNFVSNFGDLNPYELDHLSEALVVKLEEILFNRGNDEKMTFTPQDINYAMMRSMRDILLELAEASLADAKLQMARTHVGTFKPIKIREEDLPPDDRKKKNPLEVIKK